MSEINEHLCQKPEEKTSKELNNLKKCINIPPQIDEIKDSFKAFVSIDSTYNIRDGKYVFYSFSRYNTLGNGRDWNQSTLNSFGINPESTLLFMDEKGLFHIVTDKNYTENFLFSADMLDGVVEKHIVLQGLIQDMNHAPALIEQVFGQLKDITFKLTEGKSEEEKLQAIYGWILENVSYSYPIPRDDKTIYSGIHVFAQKTGVCQGYVHLMIYMLGFAGIKDMEYMSGDVINTPDFGGVGHAWLRIGDKYYDPTWDDPVYAGSQQGKTRTPDEYKYFGLPKDLFYTNRFNDGDTPDFLKGSSLKQRESLVSEKLSVLREKYSGKGFNLLKEIEEKHELGIDVNKPITIEALGKMVPIIFVQRDKGYINGDFFHLKEEDVETLISQIGFENLKKDGWKILYDESDKTYKLSKDIFTQ